MGLKEASIENYLIERVDKAGGLVVKLVPDGQVGIPDRLIVLPGGRVAFVELKRPKGGIVAHMQRWWAKRIAKLGVRHYFAQTRRQVDEIMGDETW